jgi:hypothetical protein
VWHVVGVLEHSKVGTYKIYFFMQILFGIGYNWNIIRTVEPSGQDTHGSGNVSIGTSGSICDSWQYLLVNIKRSENFALQDLKGFFSSGCSGGSLVKISIFNNNFFQKKIKKLKKKLFVEIKQFLNCQC